MIQILIKFVDVDLLQDTMDQTFGINVFQIMIDKSSLPKTCSLSYDENLDQTTVDQAMILVETEVVRVLSKTKVRLYENIDILAEKLLYQNPVFSFSEADYQIASNWLNDTMQPCPDIVILESLSNSISTIESAQTIVNKWESYQLKLTQLNNLRITGKRDILAATELIELKTVATATFDQMKNLFQNN